MSAKTVCQEHNLCIRTNTDGTMDTTGSSLSPSAMTRDQFKQKQRLTFTDMRFSSSE